VVDHPFEVGSIYTNRRGRYEVVSLDEARNSMMIRYLESGETLESPIDVQARIWENIGWEQEGSDSQVAGADTRIQKGYGEGFRGLSSGDFKLSIENTSWRSRKGLAGRVARLLSEGSHYTFVSWAIYGWPLAFLSHHEHYQMAAFEQGSRKAKFTVELDTHNIYYGLYIERNDGPMDANWDWPRLLGTLHSSADIRAVIARAEAEHAARFIGRMYRGGGHFHFSNALRMGARPLWEEASTARHDIPERLERLDAIPEDYWGEIYIVGSTPKQAAIAAGVDIAEQMVTLMRSLLPLYEAATS
jgi:hypothetical protein